MRCAINDLDRYYLRNRGVKGSNKVAYKAFAAVRSQSVTLPAQDVAASIVAELAEDVLGLKERINTLDKDLEKRFFRPSRGSDSH